MSEELTDEQKEARSMSYDSQLIYYNRLKSKYEAAERNLEKCKKSNSCHESRIEYIEGYMSGLIDGMVLLNPNLTSQCMEVENEQ